MKEYANRHLACWTKVPREVVFGMLQISKSNNVQSNRWVFK